VPFPAAKMITDKAIVSPSKFKGRILQNTAPIVSIFYTFAFDSFYQA
jgi:hypothetical protein